MAKMNASTMSSGSANERTSDGQLRLIFSEVLDLKAILQEIGSVEEKVKNALGEVANIRGNLVSHIGRLEPMVKEVSALVIEETKRDKEIKETLEREKAILEAQIEEKGQMIESQEAALQGLRETLTAKNQELEERSRERAKILEIRDAVLKNFKSAASTFNALMEGLDLPSEDNIIGIFEPDEGKPKKTSDGESKKKEKTLSGESTVSDIDELNAEIRQKDDLLAKKEREIEKIKHDMESQIKDLKHRFSHQTGNQKNSRPWRVVTRSA